jgi:putative ABC transport system ATP-binding protein
MTATLDDRSRLATRPAATATAGSPLAVVCRGVTKEFGSGDAKVQVLLGVDVDIPAGEMALLVGPSGCGKTTLISIICGLLKPTMGTVALFGVEQQKLTGRQLVDFRGKNVGFVFQQYNLLPALTAAENAAVPLIIQGVPRKQAVARATEVLDQVGMGHRANSRPAQLSGGQQQRVAIARALVHSPRLLVCDEPTAALDAQSGQTVMELLRETAVQPGRGVLIVTHDHRVFAYGDRIVRMSDGRIESVETKAAGTHVAEGVSD